MSTEQQRKCLVSMIRTPLRAKVVRHFEGLPPELQEHGAVRREMPTAALALLVIDSDASEGVMFYRFSRDGADAGDTWHPDLEEAQAQAMFEFGPALGGWIELPEDTQDPAVTARRFLLSGR